MFKLRELSSLMGEQGKEEQYSLWVNLELSLRTLNTSTISPEIEGERYRQKPLT